MMTDELCARKQEELRMTLFYVTTDLLTDTQTDRESCLEILHISPCLRADT